MNEDTAKLISIPIAAYLSLLAIRRIFQNQQKYFTYFVGNKLKKITTLNSLNLRI